MMKKVWKILLPLFVILGGFGTYGGFYFNAVNQIDISVDDVKITSFSLNTVLPFSADIDLELSGEISHPTRMNLKIQAVYFDVYLEGNFLGTGEVASFIASDIPFPLLIVLELKDLQGDICDDIRDLILLGQSKEIRLDIVKIVVFNIELKMEQSITEEITQEDVIGI